MGVRLAVGGWQGRASISRLGGLWREDARKTAGARWFWGGESAGQTSTRQAKVGKGRSRRGARPRLYIRGIPLLSFLCASTSPNCAVQVCALRIAAFASIHTVSPGGRLNVRSQLSVALRLRPSSCLSPTEPLSSWIYQQRSMPSLSCRTRRYSSRRSINLVSVAQLVSLL